MNLTVYLRAAYKPIACLALLCGLIASCTHHSDERLSQPLRSTAKFGLLIMAHGGSEQWNAGVLDSIAGLRQQYPVEVAFGMADAGSMERSIRKLEASGVSHVAVVRLLISGESWYERTLQIFGVMAGAPPKSALVAATDKVEPALAMPMGFWRIDTDLTFAFSTDGLADAEEMNAVLEDRAVSLSHNPSGESVLVLAHGPADDAENERWIEKIQARTQTLASHMNFHDIKVFTLREDWEEKRLVAEQQIREYIESANREGIEVIVLPYRVHGFGPYVQVLAGLDYRANQQGLIPHDNVTFWLENQANAMRARLLE